MGLSCDNHGMGKRGLLVVVLAVVAAVVAFLGGWSVRDAALSGHGDWGATLATLASWTGDAGKVALGALIGAVGAWIVSWQNRSDAREARLLEQRRASIVAVLTEGERATGRIEQLAMGVDSADSPMPTMDAADDFRRAWLELIVLAPDILAGPGAAYGVQVPRHMIAWTAWAFERLADVKAGHDIAPRPGNLAEEDRLLDLARTAFLLASIKHLGISGHSNVDVAKALASLKDGGD